MRQTLPKAFPPSRLPSTARTGWTNRAVEPPSKTTAEIVKSNVCTYFNLIFLIIAIFLILAGSFRDLTFLPVIIANTLIGIVQEIKAKKDAGKAVCFKRAEGYCDP